MKRFLPIAVIILLSATWYQDVLRPFAEWALRPMQADSFDSSQVHDIIHNLAKTSG